MRARHLIYTLGCFLTVLSVIPPVRAGVEPVSGPTYAVRVEYHVMVRMRDGVGLATNIYRPDAEGRFPVILVRNPYGNGSDTTSVHEGRFWASRGYVYLLQNVRGRYDSEGHYYPYIYEANDGYDTEQWAGVQPWSSGKIGTLGGSYLASVQWMPAPLRSPYLTAMAPMVSPFNYYRDVMYPGGAFSLRSRLGWGAVMGSRTNLAFRHDFKKIITRLPLITLDRALGLNLPHWRDWIRHPSYDAYWQALDVEARVPEIDVPSLNIGAWFGPFQRGTLTSYTKMVERGRTPRARRGQKLIMGPWPHGANRSTRTGDVDFGPDAVIDLKTLQLRWFDYWLKSVDNGIMDEAPVRIFVMGDDVWRDEQEWPLARMKYTPYYFHSRGHAVGAEDGALSIRKPKQEPADTYLYDPAHPVPTRGGNLLAPHAGPVEQGDLGDRGDVLTFTTAPLDTDLEVTGPVTVTLYAATTARDTDFTAKLIDVHPDGRAYNLADGIIRARYRTSFSHPTLVEPGQVYAYTIDLRATSMVFKRGHRIRVDISSSNFPQFDRNPNTGHPFGVDDEIMTATQTIYHDARRASHIMLPVIPR